MGAATSIAIFLIPAIFYMIERFTMRFGKQHEAKSNSSQPEPSPAAGD
jgi:hypothetical protein